MSQNLIVCASLLLAAACGLSDRQQQANAEQGQREANQSAARVEQAFDAKRAQLDREANEKEAVSKANERRQLDTFKAEVKKELVDSKGSGDAGRSTL
jgi:hypothetical protein